MDRPMGRNSDVHQFLCRAVLALPQATACNAFISCSAFLALAASRASLAFCSFSAINFARSSSFKSPSSVGVVFGRLPPPPRSFVYSSSCLLSPHHRRHLSCLANRARTSSYPDNSPASFCGLGQRNLPEDKKDHHSGARISLLVPRWFTAISTGTYIPWRVCKERPRSTVEFSCCGCCPPRVSSLQCLQVHVCDCRRVQTLVHGPTLYRVFGMLT